MQKYKSNITSTTGAAIRNVPVTVLNEAGELASLFLDRRRHCRAESAGHRQLGQFLFLRGERAL
jgi:hypothetical protein